MDGPSRSSLPRACARVALVALLSVAGLLAAPGTALAVGEVRPVVDCVRKNPDGSFTAVLGYSNRSSSPVTVPLGSRNKLSPAGSDGRQPTTFQPGTKQGAHAVTLTSSEYARSGGYWSIDGNIAFIGQHLAPGVASCPASTELPEEGNGTGPAIALLGAGVIGAIAVRRARGRALAGAGAQAGEVRADA